MAVGSGRGRVVELDARKGRGVVESNDGVPLPFHCTQVSDAGGPVDVGAEVRYEVVPGRLGVWEAAALELV
jgi:cold shock CspA family protein